MYKKATFYNLYMNYIHLLDWKCQKLSQKSHGCEKKTHPPQYLYQVNVYVCVKIFVMPTNYVNVLMLSLLKIKSIIIIIISMCHVCFVFLSSRCPKYEYCVFVSIGCSNPNFQFQYSDKLFQITQRIFILGYYTFSWTLMFRNTRSHSSTGFAHLS